jgi:S1-C subfamily serine protease
VRRLALAAVLVCLAGCGDGDEPQPAASTPSTRDEVVASQGGGFDAQKIYEDEADGVVTIQSLFGADGGEGSGFVLNDEGEIVTNAHVVTTGEGTALRRASEVYVEFADGNRVAAKVIGADLNADVGLLKIDPEGLELTPLQLGSSRELRVGAPVAAIGSPFGEEQSLSIGVISAIDRSIQSLTNFAISGAFQTDAAINPGNSGGPLVDGEGRVIGVNQQIKSRSGGGEGVGFAVPVDVVKRSLGSLRETGTADYAYLGVSSVPLFPQLVERFDLPVDEGAWVQEVSPGGPAERAGIRGGRGETPFQIETYAQGGDIITEVDGKPILDANDLSAVVAQFAPGEEVVVKVHRDGETKDVEVKLGERPLGDVGG